MSKQELLIFLLILRRIKTIFDNVAGEAWKKPNGERLEWSNGRWARVYTIILIYIIYLEEFIMNLMRRRSVNAIFMVLKNVNINFFLLCFILI